MTICIPRAVALVAALAVSTVAHAQFSGMSDLGPIDEPEFFRRDFPLFIEYLSLDDSQKMFLEAMHEDYHGAFEAAAAALHEAMEEVKPASLDRTNIEARRQALREEMRMIQEQMQFVQDPKLSPREREELTRIIRERAVDLQRRARQHAESQVDPSTMLPALDAAVAHIDAFIRERARLRQQFVNDFTLVLEVDQLEQWGDLEFTLERMHRVPHGQLTGEAVDLVRVVRSLDLEPQITEPLQPLLDDYTAGLVLALIARDDFVAKQRINVMRATLQDDVGAARDLLTREGQRRVAVRNLHLQYLEMLVAALPEEHAAALTRAFRTEAYGEILGPTSTERSFKIASFLTDLEPEVRDQIRTMAAEWKTLQAQLQDRIIAETMAHELDTFIARMERRIDRMHGRDAEDTENPVERAQEHLRVEGEKYVKRLGELLNEEQRRRIPQLTQIDHAKKKKQSGR